MPASQKPDNVLGTLSGPVNGNREWDHTWNHPCEVTSTHAHCDTDWGQGDRMWDNTWVAVVTVVCGLLQRGVAISGKRHPVLPKKLLGSSTFLDISIISFQLILFIEWVLLNIKLLNRIIHGPMYKWSQRGACWCLGACIWYQGICSHHIYGVTFSSFHIMISNI